VSFVYRQLAVFPTGSPLPILSICLCKVFDKLWALKAAGVPIVVAGSFGDIFKRNAINNGLVCVECPELVKDLTEAYAKNGQRGAGGKDGELTVNKGHRVNIGMIDGKVILSGPGGGEKTYAVRPVGASVQELWVCGGLEGFILKTIQAEV